MIKPKKLCTWDIVCWLTLSWWWPGQFPYRYEIGKTQFEKEFWVKIIDWKYTLMPPDRIYSNPKARAEDLMNAFKNPEIKAIISSIWWEESIRMLPYIDFDVIKNNPKIFMGYSDTTISHFICQKAWLVSFYGPAIMSGFWENWWLFPYMIDSINKVLFSSDTVGEILPNMQWWTNERLSRDNIENQNIKRKILPNEWRRWLQWKGSYSWKLIGWCIDVFPFMQWTLIWPSLDQWKNKILFLETSEEMMDTVSFERILRNLWSQWILSQVSWILLWRSQFDYSKEQQINYDDSLLKILNKELWLFDLPIITNMDFWHTDPMFVIPLWCEAIIDCDNKKFIVMENACI